MLHLHVHLPGVHRNILLESGFLFCIPNAIVMFIQSIKTKSIYWEPCLTRLFSFLRLSSTGQCKCCCSIADSKVTRILDVQRARLGIVASWLAPMLPSYCCHKAAIGSMLNLHVTWIPKCCGYTLKFKTGRSMTIKNSFRQLNIRQWKNFHWICLLVFGSLILSWLQVTLDSVIFCVFYFHT